MDSDRIERALRDGPPDEPSYLPGGFRASRPPGWWLAAASLSVGVALLAGIVIGTSLDALRRGEFGRAPTPSVLVAADLQGVWRSDPIAFQDWVDALLVRGFPQEEIDAFLEHDPFEDNVRYSLTFVGDSLVVEASFDDQPFQTLNGATFTVLDDGTLRIFEVAGGVQSACELTVGAAIDGSRLMLSAIVPGCDTDGRIAGTLFFEISSYTRVED